MNKINDFEKIYMYSPYLHQDLHQKLIKSFSNYRPVIILPNNLNEEDIDEVFHEIVKDKDCEKLNTDTENHESIEGLKYLHDYEEGGKIIPNGSNEEQMNNPRVQAMFERSKHTNSLILVISQDYFEWLKRTIRANGNIYHIFNGNNFRDVQNLYQDKTSMDMTFNLLNL